MKVLKPVFETKILEREYRWGDDMKVALLVASNDRRGVPDFKNELAYNKLLKVILKILGYKFVIDPVGYGCEGELVKNTSSQDGTVT